VRPAAPGDAGAVASILATALGAKYGPAMGPRAEEALRALVADEVARADHGYWVAELGGRVVGAAHLAVAGEAADRDVGRRLTAVLGRARATWALSTLALLSHGPLGDDDAHIGEVGVVPDARRRGVARALMLRVEERARELGKTRLSLLVTTENAPAIALYRDLGYTVRRRTRWYAGRAVFGSRGALIMEKVPEAHG
jgi:ribosomal protein S18 acetylase RimI-like enzyme